MTRQQGPVRQYRAAPGAGFTHTQAQRYGEFLDALLGDEMCAPQQIVEASRPEDAPTHECFEWSNRAAAERWRLHQARQLTNHLIVVKAVGDQSHLTKAFHSIVTRPGPYDPPVRGYVSERVVWQDPALIEQVQQEARRELDKWRARWEQYFNIANQLAALDEALRQAA